jgi:effector-binding domain-containing protein
VEIATVDPRLTAVVAETTTWQEFPNRWRPMLDEVYAVVRARPDLSADGHWQNVMLYKDGTPSVEIGVFVATDFPAEGRVHASQLPGGQVARTTHTGGYETLGAAHDAVKALARTQGFALAGPSWEIYGHPPPDGPPDIEIVYLLS